MPGERPEIVRGADSPSAATTSGENAATVSKPSVDASRRIAADSPPVPKAVVAPVAANVVNPRSSNSAVPVGAPGARVARATTGDVLVTSWSFTICACR